VGWPFMFSGRNTRLKYVNSIVTNVQQQQLRVRFFKKSKIGFLNPKESDKGFCVSLLNRSIQDLSDHGASKEPKNLLWEWIHSWRGISRFLRRTMIREISDCSVYQRNAKSVFGFFRMDAILDFLKETDPIN